MSSMNEDRWKHLWRSVEELERDPEFSVAMKSEFPAGASVWEDPLSRRRFLQIMGASFALAGLNGCTWFPAQAVVPYVVAPEEIVPGNPLFYATSHTLGGFAKGVLAETHMARPTKLEGNPDHPASLGRCDVFMQGSLLDLYDPERGKVPQYRGNDAGWDLFYNHLAREQFPKWKETGGRGVRILTGTVTSPTLTDLIREFLAKYPESRWHSFEPVNRDNAIAGAKLAFGKAVSPLYRLDRADVIVSFASDFLVHGPANVIHARGFSDRRRLSGERSDKMNRLYMVESGYSVTGSNADARIAAKPSRIPFLLRVLASKIGASKIPSEEIISPEETRWVEAAAQALIKSRGKSIVIVADDQTEAAQAIGHWINEQLGALGNTLDLIDRVDTSPESQGDSIAELCEEMKRGEIDSLIMTGVDPVFTAPADLSFAELLKKVPHRYCHSVFKSKTSFHSDWYLPEPHFLEDWGDPRAFDGTVSLQQPAVAPLYQPRGRLELFSALLGHPGSQGSEILKNYWKKNGNAYFHAGEDFDAFWERALRDGFIRDSRSRTIRSKVVFDILPSIDLPGDGIEIQFAPDPTIWDGTYASNPWLQELPKPPTQLTWDNAAILSPTLAKRHQLATEDVVRIQTEDGSLEAAVFVLPGQADDTLTLHLGYSGEKGEGFNTYRLRTSDGFWSSSVTSLAKTNRKYRLATSQHHQEMNGRNMAVLGKLAAYRQNPGSVLPNQLNEVRDEALKNDLYANYPYAGEAWAMVIDLNVCIGCKVCTLACQAENNIPVVGKDQVIANREMHWIRVDRYFHGDPANPSVAFQPVPCMHCEKAPCEYVCPVMATVHDSSGINQMIYNRCVGTRDCSNNCPYKVRRFNFLQYSDMKSPLKRLVYNPEVTVRERGVMEKCTYCIQRINAAKIVSQRESRPIKAGEIVPACAQACPTKAIVFGNKNNPLEEVSRLKKHPLNYELLEEQGTRPRTTYLARIKNTDPSIEPGLEAHEHA